MSTRVCPECEQGKHQGCTGWALTEDDEFTTCPCPHETVKPAPVDEANLPDLYAPDVGEDFAGRVVLGGDVYTPDEARTIARALVLAAEYAEEHGKAPVIPTNVKAPREAGDW